MASYLVKTPCFPSPILRLSASDGFCPLFFSPFLVAHGEGILYPSILVSLSLFRFLAVCWILFCAAFSFSWRARADLPLSCAVVSWFLGPLPFLPSEAGFGSSPLSPAPLFFLRRFYCLFIYRTPVVSPGFCVCALWPFFSLKGSPPQCAARL